MSNKKALTLLGLLLVIAMLFVACGGAEEPAEEPAAEPTEAPAGEEEAEEPPAEEEGGEMAEVDFAVIEGGALEQALTGEFEGTQVTVDGPFVDADEVRFSQSVRPFEEATGIDVIYIGSKEFESAIAVRVEAGDPPDIADFPQPGLMSRIANLQEGGTLVDPTTFMPMEWLEGQYNPSWIDMTRINVGGSEQIGGIFHRYNAKSLVWYPVDDFEASGYEVPETWDELLALSDQIVSDGDSPWCIGIGSGTATGWPATDWTEETMLRTTSLENYDAWVAGELPFDSPEVREAIQTWSEIWFNDDYVLGGTDSIVTTNFDQSPAPMFEDPPRCWLHKQGNFITGFFPEDAVAFEDYSFFYLPMIEEEYGEPWLVAGDIMSMFNDRPEVRALMEYFTVPQSAGGWLSDGGALAAHESATPEMYGQPIERGIAELVQEADAFRFDASDLMPSEVGSGTFWTGMVDYVSGSADLDTVLQDIDESWPEQ